VDPDAISWPEPPSHLPDKGPTLLRGSVLTHKIDRLKAAVRDEANGH
jgi:hypothetical protein